MKKLLYLMLAMPLMMACQKNEPTMKIVGEYTYYISGNVRWWGEGNDGEYSALEPEKGLLKITAEKDACYLATFYTEGGDFFTCDVAADDEQVYLTHGRRNLKVEGTDCSVLFSGEQCHLTSDGFIGSLSYQGNPLGNYSQSFVSDHVSIVATKK